MSGPPGSAPQPHLGPPPRGSVNPQLGLPLSISVPASATYLSHPFQEQPRLHSGSRRVSDLCQKPGGRPDGAERARSSFIREAKPNRGILSRRPPAYSVTAQGLFSIFASLLRKEAPATPANQTRLWPVATEFQILK